MSCHVMSRDVMWCRALVLVPRSVLLMLYVCLRVSMLELTRHGVRAAVAVAVAVGATRTGTGAETGAEMESESESESDMQGEPTRSYKTSLNTSDKHVWRYTSRSSSLRYPCIHACVA